MKLDVLAVGAHPDDVELSCSGTLIKLARAGKKVGIVDLTAGKLGTRGNPEIRTKEAESAARIMGVQARECLSIADGEIVNSRPNRLKLVQVLRRHRPDILLLPYHTDRHPDHENAHILCREAWFQAGLEKLETLENDVKQNAFRPRQYYCYMQWFEFVPSFIVDITDVYDVRMQAVGAYRSQFYDPSSREPETILSTPEFLRMIETRLRYYGDRIGATYGEPFFSLSSVGVSSLFDVRP